MPRYTNGPLDIGFNYHRIKSEESDAVKISNWTLAGSYDFGAVKLAAAYEQSRWNDVLGVDDDDLKLKAWMLGATVPFGKHALIASWNQSNLDWGAGTAARDGRSRWAIPIRFPNAPTSSPPSPTRTTTNHAKPRR
jgi:predicted porin